MVTNISPLASPNSSGKSIIKLRPVSSTVAVKSVPLTKIWEVGVYKVMFFLLSLLTFPEIKRMVPLANDKAISELSGLGS